MERELPIINIERTDFLVDVIKEELKEKANIQNVVGINKMYYVGDGYSFDYDQSSKIILNINLVRVSVPSEQKGNYWTASYLVKRIKALLFCGK
ncbi:hypothetical protein D0809_11615 [Flavobacterium circumlabens]|uniref:Uncharacterized protein n=1 Tax=Flavobacterium circumlabens TaxID=2133765 RepID=A0A4Y7UDI8_9FLAO|nr:hypothetical protein [Flavobacterium circumlabens]TCN58991.1 hypothetical protein EV142_103440 [Flavobacterium circumlabens]TEB44394.1 hypothetical protein D0809_11615 [Flavobacterium circumlabens]